MVLIQKIISAVMALIMSVFGFILPSSDIKNYSVAGDVIRSGSSSRYNVGTPEICRSYSQLEAFCRRSNSDELMEYLEEIDEKAFENYCAVAVNFAVPDPSYRIYVTEAYIDGKTLVIDYVRACFSAYVSASVISYDTAVLFADKNIRSVRLNQGADMEIDFFDKDSAFGFSIEETHPVAPYYPDNGCFDGSFVFEDYESWVQFRDNGGWDFSKFDSEIANEKFFENNNLVVVITTHSSGGYSLHFSECSENGEEAEIELRSVYEPGVHLGIENYEAALIAVSKKVKTANVKYKEVNLPFRLDGFVNCEIII